MIFKYLLLLLFLFSCTENINLTKNTKINHIKKFTSTGFTLIYDKKLYENKVITKKLKDRELYILHSFLKPKTYVKIFNPLNSKTVIAQVKYKADYPKIYNSVISKRLSEELSLNPEEPYVEIIEIKKNETFTVKKAKIFDEEKNVANKAPVTDVNINIISLEKEKIADVKSNFIIVVGEYYYVDTAKIIEKRLKNQANLPNVGIKKISENKYRVFVGNYSSFNTMKEIYFIINKLGFEHLNVIKLK